MSTQASSFHRVVVEDVIKSIREDFINEGVDEQVLDDLKQVSTLRFLFCYYYISHKTQSFAHVTQHIEY